MPLTHQRGVEDRRERLNAQQRLSVQLIRGEHRQVATFAKKTQCARQFGDRHHEDGGVGQPQPPRQP